MQREFAFIDEIRRRASEKRHSDSVVLGIGDDAAILRPTPETESLISTDLLVEEIDFRREYVVPSWLGHKVLAVSLSDIAAMGGRSQYSLLSLGIPSEFGSEFWNEFFDGYFALADRYGVSLIGGDTSASPERLVLDSIVMGECVKGRAVTRSGARVGDDIWVTGTLGAATAGLRLLLAGERVREGEVDAVQAAIRRHLRPDPPVEFGRLLGEAGLAHSMIDISDGLAQDMRHICDASGVTAEIEEWRIPVADELELLMEESDEAFDLAINGGEDFELLFTADPDDAERVRALAERAGVGVSFIGKIIERGEASLYFSDPSARRPVEVRGYEHFS
jgi:thiamine-monophosphate kinase